MLVGAEDAFEVGGGDGLRVGRDELFELGSICIAHLGSEHLVVWSYAKDEGDAEEMHEELHKELHVCVLFFSLADRAEGFLQVFLPYRAQNLIHKFA